MLRKLIETDKTLSDKIIDSVKAGLGVARIAKNIKTSPILNPKGSEQLAQLADGK